MNRTLRLVLSALGTTVACAAVATTASAGTIPTPPAASHQTASTRAVSGSVTATQVSVDPGAVKAFAAQQKISVAAAASRLAAQEGLGARGAALVQSLGTHTGGSYLAEDGSLVVTATDAAADRAATAGGARSQRVRHTSGGLQAIMDQLDTQARTHGAGSVQGWYIDVPNNVVVVTTTGGARDAAAVALTKLATAHGDAVRVEGAQASVAPKPAEYMVGGYQFVIANGGTCSVGFNTVDSANRNVVLTAGHCVKQSGIMSRNGLQIGATRTANYPGTDYGTFWNSYPSYWVPSASVYLYNNSYLTVRGSYSSVPVGTAICKSGRTTGWTCGKVTAVNQTVTYTGGYVINGLVRHNACVEGGDSGGANVTPAGYAVGLTSGASSMTSGQFKGLCLSKAGQANVSYYQPIAPALRANGLRLLVG